MLLIILVIAISIGGILYLLFSNSKPKKPTEVHDKRAIHPSFSSESINDFLEEEVHVAFDKPTEIQLIEVRLEQSTVLKNSESVEKFETEISNPENPKSALTTNSKINPFNF
jgi:hypothetical protein